MDRDELKIKEQEHREDLARLRGLRPIDDDFMRCIFRNNIPLAQMVLRILTGKNDLIVEELETQADFKRLVGARSIMLDAYVTDSESKKYDMEVQRADRGADKHRARYHSSAMDIENLNAGQYFDELPETYTILITENDVFGDKKPFHRIERVDLDGENQPLFNDEEHILYVNGAYRGDNEIGRLMHDFSCWNPDDMNYELLRDVSRYYKEDPKGVEIMCEAFEETRKAGEKKGEMKHAIETAKRMIAKGKLTLEEISEYVGLPFEQVQKLAEGKA